MKGKKISPQRILEIDWAYAKTRVLAAGVELDVFTHIAEGKKTVAAISRVTKSSRRGIEMLLNALAGLGLLAKDKRGAFTLAPDADEFLVRTRPRYLGEMTLHALDLNKIWLHLTESIRSGRPYSAVDEEAGAEDYFPVLVRGLFQMNYPCAKYAALYLKRKHKKISEVLDVAAGSGVWSIGIAQQFKTAKVTALDFPEVLRVTREYVNRFKLQDRYKYIAGDLRRIDFGKERYGLIILGHICHSEGRVYTEQLIKKSFRGLKKGGVILIADFLANNNKSGPLMPLLFALNMLINTNEGDVFSLSQFRQWFSSAGFKQIKILDKSPSLSPLIFAVKQ